MSPEATPAPSKVRLRCPTCEDLVRVSLAPGRPEASCSTCSESIPVAHPLPLTEADFAPSVLEAEVPVLVAFSADWCAPCKWLDPYLDEVVANAPGRLLAFKVDVDGAADLARRYGIASVPTVLLIRSGTEETRSLGVEPERLRDMARGPG